MQRRGAGAKPLYFLGWGEAAAVSLGELVKKKGLKMCFWAEWVEVMVTGLACGCEEGGLSWPGSAHSPASGGQRDRASHHDLEGWPQKVEGGAGHMPWAVPHSSCGMTAMGDVDETCIFCSCAVACLVFRESLQIHGSEFVTLYRCVQTPPGHRDLLKLVCRGGVWEGRCARESRQVGRQQAHPRQRSGCLSALLCPRGVRSLLRVPGLLLRPVC